MIDSLHDLSDRLTVEDAAAKLRRALDPPDSGLLAAWAREWGEAAVAALRDAPAKDDDLEEAEERISKLEKALDEIDGEAEAGRKLIDTVDPDDPEANKQALGRVEKHLERIAELTSGTEE